MSKDKYPSIVSHQMKAIVFARERKYLVDYKKYYISRPVQDFRSDSSFYGDSPVSYAQRMTTLIRQYIKVEMCWSRGQLQYSSVGLLPRRFDGLGLHQ